MANIIVFGICAAVIIVAALCSVFTKRIMRSATALLFVLFGVAGMYFLLDYTFLGTVQLSIYAGAVTMIYIFAIQLVGKNKLQGVKENVPAKRICAGVASALIGAVAVLAIVLKNDFIYRGAQLVDEEIDMQTIGNLMVGADKYQYVLPFEFISVFLLACIIGGLMIARSNNKEEEK